MVRQPHNNKAPINTHKSLEMKTRRMMCQSIVRDMLVNPKDMYQVRLCYGVVGRAVLSAPQDGFS